MSVELPFAPVDSLIREADPDIRVSSSAAERLAARIQDRGSSLAVEASEKANMDRRKTIMAEDFGFEAEAESRDELILPIAPVDRIARLDIEDYRMSEDARVALTEHLEEWAVDVARRAVKLARHSGRKTVQGKDVDAYFEICRSGDDP
ncbi:MAG: histone [Halobacteria archaeon]